jgi:hypothetical protein
MVVKLSIVIVVSFFIFSFSEKKEKNNPTTYKTTFEKGLFESDEMLSITLKGNIRQLLNDRADKPTSHSITLSYRDKDSSEVIIPVQNENKGAFQKIKRKLQIPAFADQLSCRCQSFITCIQWSKKIETGDALHRG